MKILNLYAGIGGNRKLWSSDHKITAIELNPEIAKVYQEFFPYDTVIVGDAHQYLLEHYKEFDFIWASPPCPSHSRIRKMGAQKNLYPAIYPDFALWQEVTLLQHFHENKWIIENVVPYYTPIIEASFKLDRHCFWSNIVVPYKKFKPREKSHKDINGGNDTIFGINLSKYNIKDKRRLLRNMVNPELGKHILDCALNTKKKKEKMTFKLEQPRTGLI